MLQFLPNAAPVEDRASPVYFLHIPKTGGTTVHNFLASQFAEQVVCPAHVWHQLLPLPPEQIGSYSFIWGHFYAYLYRHAPMPMRYVTFVRDPVERALSHYGHVVLHADHYLHARARELGDFGAYLRDPELATTLNNFQVKSFALDLDPHSIWANLSGQGLGGLELERRLETATPSLSDAEMLAIAKTRLGQMCFIGITERLDESLALLCHQFGWHAPAQVESRNANASRVRASEIAAGDLALLREVNAADFELYEFANRLFEEALGGMAGAEAPR